MNKRDLYIKAQAASTPSNEWVRNPDWLPLPTITASDNRLVALFLVFENEYNQMSVYLTNLSVDVDWGDGTTTTSNGAVQSHVYDYATISGAVNQYYDGRNYKQVIIDLTYNGTGTWTYCNLSGNTGVNNFGQINIVDIDCSLPDCTGLILGQQRKMLILEQLKVRNMQPQYWNSLATQMYKLRSVDFPFDKLTQMINPTFGGVENFGDVDLSNATNISIGFSGGRHYSFGNINSGSTTALVRTFEGCVYLRRVNSLDCASCTSIQQVFNNCLSLNYAVLNNCGNIITTTNAFNVCYSLSTLILNGITVSFSVVHANMDATALNALFTSLGTAAGTQTVTVTGNPGASTCDTSIATAKGWTVAT